MVWPQLLLWLRHKPSHLISNCLGSSPAHETASVVPHFTGLLSWWWIWCHWSTRMHRPMQEREQRLCPNKHRFLPQRQLLFAGWTHGQLVKCAAALWGECQPQRVPKCKDGEMMTGFLRWRLTVAQTHCGEKERKQNKTIGRRPWKALENKSPALNHSQQNNHKCGMRKRPNYALLFAFYHCSQSKCLSLSIYKFEMPAQILKSDISNTSVI